MRTPLVLATLLLCGSALAEPTIRIQADEGDRIVAGGSVRQASPIDGDLVGMAGDFVLAAPVKGKALIAAGNLRVTEPVGGDLFAGGGNVTLSSRVAHHAHVAGGNVDIEPAGSVGGDLYTAGGDVSIRGAVGGSVHVGAGNVTIDSEVGGDVRAASGELVLGPNARIGGKVVHRGANVRRDPAATVGGGVVRERVESRRERMGLERSASGWWWTLGLVGLAALIAAAFPAAVREAAGQVRAHPGVAFLAGFIALVCIPIAAVILMITIIGLPVALIALLLYFVLLMVGYATAGVLIGDFALGRLRPQDAAQAVWRVGAAVAAVLLLALLSKIPFLGGLVVLAALLGGIGAIVLAIAHRPRAAAPVAA